MTMERIYIVKNETSNLMNGVASKQCKQADIASMYCDLMVAVGLDPDVEAVDWAAVNTAIVNRRSMSGLVRIKKMAWKELESTRQGAK